MNAIEQINQDIQNDNVLIETIRTTLSAPDQTGFAYYTHTFDNKDQLCIEIKKSKYARMKEGDEIVVLYGEYMSPGCNPYAPNEAGYMVTGSERYNVQNQEKAIRAFISRLKSSEPYKVTGNGMAYEDIFEKE